MPADRSHIEALVNAYPRLLRGLEGRLWFPRGWAEVVHRLFRQLNEVLDDQQASIFEVLELKEKYGTLRVYYSAGKRRAMNIDVMGPDGHARFVTQPKYPTGFPSGQIDALIGQAEEDTAGTCVFCGAPGSMRLNHSWIHVACDACETTREKRRS